MSFNPYEYRNDTEALQSAEERIAELELKVRDYERPMRENNWVKVRQEVWSERSERIAELEVENAKLRELIAQCATDFEAAADGSGVNFYQCAVDLRAALPGGE